MMSTELNRCPVPIWEDDEDELPEGVPFPTEGVDIGGKYDAYFFDEVALFNFPSCFAERL